MQGVCSITKNEPTKINFLATVRIPVGYKIVEPPEYVLHFTMDSSNLKTDSLVELKESIIVLEKDAQGNPTRTLDCSSKVTKVILHGTIYYNLIIEKFKTAQALDSSLFTAFSTNDVVPVDIVLGYACAECDFPQDTLYGFEVSLSKLDEFVITHSGSQIFYNEQDPDEFFTALADPNDSEVIQVPYTLTITPMVPND